MTQALIDAPGQAYHMSAQELMCYYLQQTLTGDAYFAWAVDGDATTVQEARHG